MNIQPIGARCYVLPDPPVDEVSVRAKAAGLHVVVDARNMPRPTTGVVVAIGGDPLINELIQVGDKVFFSKYCNNYITDEGTSYLDLELNEIRGVKKRLVDSATVPPSQSEQPQPGHQPAEQLMLPGLLDEQITTEPQSSGQ